MKTTPEAFFEITGGILTILEVAERLRCSTRTVWRLLERGDLIATRIPDGTRRVTVRSLERMLARGVEMRERANSKETE